MISFSRFSILAFPLFFFAVFSCSDDKAEPKQETKLPPPVEKKIEVVSKPPEPEPVVYIEELDQYQEYFKEQHETSFSHVNKKNWTSFTAGKDGILTKIMLFGKPNYQISEHYGSSMSGFVRAENPDSGPKYGEWSLSREEIVNQLALQGLKDTDRGWITIQMRGNIPQQAGKLYFLVCDKISDKRAWFGAFAFAEGNSYKKGRFWLHPDHDLVFRTYVGKTAEHLEKEQRGEPLFETASLVQSKDIPEAPKPMIEMSRNFQPPTVTAEKPINPDPPIEEKEKEAEPLYKPATLEVKPTEPTKVLEAKPAMKNSIADPREEKPAPSIDAEPAPAAPQEDVPRRSLFDRFFQKETD